MIFLKRSVFKNFSAVVMVAAILFTTMFSLSVITAHKAGAVSFTPRLVEPSYDNKYYFDDDYNVFEKYGYGMPNCTAYAYGRAYEILGKEPKLSWNGAGQWYDYNRSNGYYSYGSTPKVGAIACWCYPGGGHVAVVEQIDSDGSMTLSNSAYGRYDLFFYLTHAKTTDSNPGGSSWWTFQGYIYLVDSADVVTPDVPSGYQVGNYTVNVKSYLNMRSGAGLGYSVVQPVYGGTKINVTETKFADGYNWGKTTVNGKSGWLALDYCTYVEDKPVATEPTTAAPTTEEPTTVAPTTEEPTTVAPTTEEPTTAEPTTDELSDTDVPFVEGIGTGDIDGDGRISILDATIIQRYLAGICKLNEKQIGWCDFDFSGRVSIDDVTCMQRYLSYGI